MPPPKHDAHLFELAKRGAETRLSELLQEIKNLIGLFPHLRDSFDEDELPISFIIRRNAGPGAGAGRDPKRRMSAAARKA
jgi:hypothetical protein